MYEHDHTTTEARETTTHPEAEAKPDATPDTTRNATSDARRDARRLVDARRATPSTPDAKQDAPRDARRPTTSRARRPNPEDRGRQRATRPEGAGEDVTINESEAYVDARRDARQFVDPQCSAPSKDDATPDTRRDIRRPTSETARRPTPNDRERQRATRPDDACDYITMNESEVWAEHVKSHFETKWRCDDDNRLNLFMAMHNRHKRDDWQIETDHIDYARRRLRRKFRRDATGLSTATWLALPDEALITLIK